MLNERDRAFLRPRWLRLLITLLCVIWAAVEWYGQQPFWAIIASGLAAYCYWELIHKFEEPH